MKTCKKCGKEKPLESFPWQYDSNGRTNRRVNSCFTCKSSVRSEEGWKKKAVKNRDRLRLKKWRDSGLNITASQYQEMLLSQNGVCAVCGSPGKGRRLAVDHCHKTGIIRGLLCSSCNLGIGYFGDDPDRLRQAIKYLEKMGRGLGPDESPKLVAKSSILL